VWSSTEKLATTIRWREDVERGEMIEQRKDGFAYRHDYLGFPRIKQKTLDNICIIANKWWELNESPLRIYWAMGEFRPASVVK
jgi:hypothetical protein